MKKFCNFFLFPFLCVIFLLNPLFDFVDLSCSASASAALEYDLFWEVLAHSIDIKNQSIYDRNFIMLPSDEFNSALQSLVQQNFPFGATPILQNQSGSIPITLTSTPKAYVPFGYNDIQSSSSSNFNLFGQICLVISNDYYYGAKLSSIGFTAPSSSNSSTPSGNFVWGFSRTVSNYIRFYKYNSDNDALFNVNPFGEIYTGQQINFTLFGVFECPCDDTSIFVPPVSSLPSGCDVYIPKGAMTISELSYKVGDDFYDIEGNPISDPEFPNSGDPSGSLGGDITVGGKIDVEGKVDVDVNVNINDGKKDDPNDYIDPGEIDTNLDNYLQYVPDVSKGFIDYLKDFFSWLPPPVFGILMLGLVVAVFCRLTGR